MGMIFASLLIPLVIGVVILMKPFGRSVQAEKTTASLAIAGLVATLAASAIAIVRFARGTELSCTLWSLTDRLSITFSLDKLGAFFLAFIPLVWLLAGIFSTEYLHHEQNKTRFWGFYLLTLSALQGLSFAGNLVTMYLFFEMMTLVSMPLVLHTQSHEAIMAGVKYLAYSMAGAYMALFGIFVMYHMGTELSFTPGGVIDASAIAQHPVMFYLAVFFLIVGFGVKAGMFPMHAWLPTAHPVAPAPASAVLSAIIVKGGVLALIRSVYYIAGAEHIAGTWVQYAWIGLAMFTVFMGSMLAYNEKAIKKRFAYSSVSQASYIMLGLAILNPTALTGALLHVLFHAFIKTALFLTAGAIIYKTGCTRVDELRGIGKAMPVTIWCYTLASLALIGIPPASGFISKWYLATGLLGSDMHVISWLGPVVLLVSALLTAGYLLPITMQGFLPGADFAYKKLQKKEPSWRMTVPLLILAFGALFTGIFPAGMIRFLSGIAQSLL